MEQMIGIINENLKSVLAGIKGHRFTTEKDLEVIKNSMDEKVSIVREYKTKVDKSKEIISNLEEEIRLLESDLNELHEKFGTKDFVEIISVGNKEINSKIAGKRDLIQKESSNISKLTDDAKVLKEDLIVLKEKKSITEENLEKAVALEHYYTEKIENIIDYSENNIAEIYKLNGDAPIEINEDLVNANIENNIDGSIFEEIENIDLTELNEEDEIDDFSIDLNETSVEDDSITGLLEKVIAEANDLVKKSNELEEKTKAYVSEFKDDDYTLEEISEEDNLSLVEYNDNDDLIPYTGDINYNQFDDNKHPEVLLTEEVELEENESVEDNVDLEKIAVEQFLDSDVVLDSDDELIDLGNEAIDLEDVKEESENIEEQPIEELKENESDLDLESNLEIEDLEDELDLEALDRELNSFDTIENLLDSTSDENSFDKEEVVEEIKETPSEEFDELDLVSAIENVKKSADLDDYRNILANNNIDVNLVTEDLAKNISSEELNETITLLKRNGVSSENVKNVFSVLDKIDPDKLEKNIMKKRESRLTDLLFNAMKTDIDDVLAKELELTSEEEEKLRSNISEKEYKQLNTFSNIVKQNVNLLKEYNIDNLKDCITTHPMRFLDNPDDFKEMLNKYDEEDLVRCINKNPAVLDKL